jgi:hypothetical protein
MMNDELKRKPFLPRSSFIVPRSSFLRVLCGEEIVVEIQE